MFPFSGGTAKLFSSGNTGALMAMPFGDAIGEGFFNYANFRDRAARAEYWWWVLFSTVVLVIAAILDFLIFRGWSVGPFYLVFGLAAFLPGLSVTVRRLHDSNRSGWWIMLPIVATVLFLIGSFVAVENNPLDPLSGPGLIYAGLPAILVIGTSILLLVWMLFGSTPGNNRYGPNRYAA
jgi:uncharacterized membrane protein YhaH (DUF805 family)